jgi:general secretion pathway protein G
MKIKGIKRKRGMSMIELLMVLVIMGSIIAILITSLTKNQSRAEGKLSKLKMQMDWAKINAALSDYKRTYGNYPDSNAGLEALVNPPESEDGKKVQSFIDRESILDQWKKPYHFELNENGFKVQTLGADGVIGGEGINADVDLATVQ